MAKTIGSITNFSGKIDDIEKGSISDSCAFAASLNLSQKEMTVNPRSQKDSGSVVLDLVMDSERVNSLNYFYGNAGNLYKENSGTWSLEHTAADSQGNGLSFFGEDDNLYYSQNKTIGRFGPVSGTANWTDDFLGQAGGEPTNTNSLDLEAGSSQHAFRADTASLSIVGDLSLESYSNPESLPTTGNSMTLISKWDENTDLRSYKLDIAPVSNFFKDGSDGAFVNSTTATDDPHDANCSGTLGNNTVTTSNEHASFNPSQGDEVVIIQMRGTNAGTRQFATVESFSGSTLTISDTLTFSPTHDADVDVAEKAQVVVLKKYTDYTVNGTLSCKPWDGLLGGIIGGYGTGTFSGSGTVNLEGQGYRGGEGINIGSASGRGEGTGGNRTAQGTTTTRAANGNGGGSSAGEHSSGASGGNATAGQNANVTLTGVPGVGGETAGANDLTTVVMGGAASGISGGAESLGGADGGAIAFFFFTAVDLSSMTFNNNGADGANHTVSAGSGASGGAGGSSHFKCQAMDFGSSGTTADGGTGGTKSGTGANGVAGGEGRIHVDFLTSHTGTTSPAYTFNEDSTLGSADGYALRLHISDDGIASEIYSQTITDEIAIGSFARWQVKWDALSSTATFFKSGVLLGTKTGSMTTIHDNASRFAIGCDFDTSAQNFLDGLIDDIRVWNDVRSTSEFLNNNNKVLVGTESNLVGYWKLDGDYTDAQTSGLNDLTASGSPVFSTDVPFSGLTTRNDQDQSNTATGQTYSLTTAINEGATHRETFIPAKDPQESIEIEIVAIGTGDWTITVHDGLNRTVASKAVSNGDLNTSFYEFIFDTAWRPVIGASYHYHLTSTVADGTVVTGIASDLEDSQFKTFFQFLVDDKYHPIRQHLNFLAIANERYLATLEGGDVYDPHRLTLPSGTRIRALGFWREFLAIGTWRGTSITDYDQGRIFFWDGTNDTYNFFIDVPEGGVNTLVGTKGLLYVWAGYSGDMLVYGGGDAAQKIKKIPKINKDISKSIEILPNASDMWRGLITFGVGDSTSTDVERGVYTWGSLNRIFPQGLAFDYPLSLGRQTGTGVKIGMVHPSGQNLFTSWQNSNTFGVDKVSLSNEPYQTATYETLIIDYNLISQQHLPLLARVDFQALRTGETITIKVKKDRADSWTILKTQSTVGATTVRGTIRGEAKEIQLAVDVTCLTTSPTITGITLESDDARETRPA